MRVPRPLIAATTAALLPLGLLVAAPLANAAPNRQPRATSPPRSSPPTRSPPPAPLEVGANGKPIQANLSGKVSTLPGSLLGQVAAVTASDEYRPKEIAANLTDEDPSTKWLVFATTGWVTYQLAKPATVVRYSLTAANDAPERDPKDFVIQGSNDGRSLDRPGQAHRREVQRALRDQQVQLHQHHRLRLLPAQRHRELR